MCAVKRKNNLSVTFHLHLAAERNARETRLKRPRVSKQQLFSHWPTTSTWLHSWFPWMACFRRITSDVRSRISEAWMRFSSHSNQPWYTDTQLPPSADARTLWPRQHRLTSSTLTHPWEWSTTRKDDNSASDWTVSNASDNEMVVAGGGDKPTNDCLLNVSFVFIFSCY